MTISDEDRQRVEALKYLGDQARGTRLKLFEVRDRATFIPVMAVLVNNGEWLFRRAGFGSMPMVYLTHLTSNTCQYDPFAWTNRTMKTAHLHITENWDALPHGAVIDVEYVLGESAAPKTSERLNEV
jgi:hypothetical protein